MLQLLAAFLGNSNDTIIGDHFAATDVEFLQLLGYRRKWYDEHDPEKHAKGKRQALAFPGRQLGEAQASLSNTARGLKDSRVRHLVHAMQSK